MGFLVHAIEHSAIKYWELSDEDCLAFNMKRIRILNELKASFGLEYVVHAPWGDLNIASLNPFFRRFMLKRLIRSLNFASLLEARLWVFHPGAHSGLSILHPGKDLKVQLASVQELLKIADDLGVSISIENMPEPSMMILKRVEDFEMFYHEAAVEDVSIAFDVGHANTVGQVHDFLERLHEKIVHIHVHDNRGVMDEHLPIGKGTVDWVSIISFLRREHFDGLIIIETLENPLESFQKMKALYSEYGTSTFIKSSAT
ncbi:MAG: sugar phosphate isomerase/epimerase family protein [Candidatus Bathyarchaeia archaeon]